MRLWLIDSESASLQCYWCILFDCKLTVILHIGKEHDTFKFYLCSENLLRDASAC